MITKICKNYLYTMLCGITSPTALIPMKNTRDTTKYVAPGYINTSNSFPVRVGTSIAYSDQQSGVVIGTGTAEPTDNDNKMGGYGLGDLGITGTVTKAISTDNDGNPELTYTVSLTNGGSASRTITEIGYQQMFACSTTLESTSMSYDTFLLDHTLLDEPLTLAPSASATITYKLKSILE